MECGLVGRNAVVGNSMVGGRVAVAGLGMIDSRSSFRRLVCRVGTLIVAQCVLALVLGVTSLERTHFTPHPLAFVGVVAAFALAGAFDMSIEFRRHTFTFTLIETVLVIGLFAVSPIELAVAAALGEIIDMLWKRQTRIKLAFNATNRLAAATTGAVVFATIGRTDVHDATAWLAALGAALCFSFVDVASTSAVMSIVERTRFHDVFVRSVSAGALATLAAAPIGLVTIDLANHGPFTPLLLVPVAVAVALNSRYAIAQRDEHLRFERLYGSLARTAQLRALEEALGALAAEARTLGTGSVALCCATGLDDTWIGARADDHGRAAASHEAVAAAVALAGEPGTALVVDAPELRAIAPDARYAVVLSSPSERARVVLVVVRDAAPTAAGKSRIETLEAFAYQASLIVSNALPHEERAAALARQIDLNRQKSDFVAAVSHELRTPLGVMLGSVHTLERLDGRMTDAQREQLFDMTIEQGARLQRLIDELLLVAAAEHSAMSLDEESIHPMELFESIRSTVSTTARHLVHCDADTDPVVTDRSKLERILGNLVENAVKYAPASTIELRAVADGDAVTFAVADHGPGIPPEDRERVFERFVQLDQSSTRRQGGTGLGLHLCRQLADVIDAELMLAETPGGGCTFTLRVPTARRDPVQSTPGTNATPVLARPDALATATPERVP